MSTMRQRYPIDAGDTLRHIPSGEEWLAAATEEYGPDVRVWAYGWPCAGVRIQDCKLIERATEERCLIALKEWAAQGGAHDVRVSIARRRLTAEGLDYLDARAEFAAGAIKGLFGMPRW